MVNLTQHRPNKRQTLHKVDPVHKGDITMTSTLGRPPKFGPFVRSMFCRVDLLSLKSQPHFRLIKRKILKNVSTI